MTQTSTPSPLKAIDENMGFGRAMKSVVDGKSVRRVSWPNNDNLFLRAGYVHIKNSEGEHRVVISDADILATDWVVVNTVQ